MPETEFGFRKVKILHSEKIGTETGLKSLFSLQQLILMQ